jgi:hypothetical protein
MTPDAQFRRLQVWGLIFLALVIAAVAILRASPGTVFPPGWFRF